MSLWERAVGGYASAVEESGGALTRGAANRYLSAKAGECGDAGSACGGSRINPQRRHKP
jgi:hypothetical protein